MRDLLYVAGAAALIAVLLGLVAVATPGGWAAWRIVMLAFALAFLGGLLVAVLGRVDL